MDVKPWEPVTYRWLYNDSDLMLGWGDSWGWGQFDDPCSRISEQMPLRVTLKSGQRIIVRALSEERKAARRARQEALK